MINKTFVKLALCCHSQQFVVFRTQTQIWGCWKERITDYCVKNHKAVQWKNKQWSKLGLDGAGSKQEGSTVECVEGGSVAVLEKEKRTHQEKSKTTKNI